MEPGNGITCDGCRAFAWRNGELVMQYDALHKLYKVTEEFLIAKNKECEYLREELAQVKKLA